MANNLKEKGLFKKTRHIQKIKKIHQSSFKKIQRSFTKPLSLSITIVLFVLITAMIVLLVRHIDGQNNIQQSNSSSSQSSNNEKDKMPSTEQTNQNRDEDVQAGKNNGQQSSPSSSQNSNSSQQPNNTENANNNAANDMNNQSGSANGDTPNNDTCSRRTAHYPCVPEFYETAPTLVFNQSFYDEMHNKTTDDMKSYFLAHYRELLEPALSFNKRLENVIYNADYTNKIQYYIDNYQEEADGYMRHLLSTYYGSGNAQTLNYNSMSYAGRKKAQFDKFLYWDWSTKRRHVTCDKMISYLRDYESAVGGSWECSEHFTDLIITPAH